MTETYYTILGVETVAAPDQIKAAYRRKVLEVHPDLYGPDTGPFLTVREAYSVLSDPERREEYDRSLRAERIQIRSGAASSGRIRPGPAWAERPARRSPIDPGEISVTLSFETVRPSVEELFDRLWGNFTGSPRPKAEQPKGLMLDVPVSADQARSGGQIRVLVPAVIACPACGGYGGVGPFECWRCGGEGSTVGEYPVTVAYPAGIVGDHVVTAPLYRMGIRNLYLTVRFRVV